MSSNQSPAVTGQGITRRKITTGLAWTAPVVAMGVAAPHAAASGAVWFEPLDIACKLPGARCLQEIGVKKGYVIQVRVCTSIPYAVDITIRDATISLNGGPTSSWEVVVDESSLTGGVTATTVADPDDTPDPNDDILPDPVLHFPAPSNPTNPTRCVVVNFAIQGEPSSQNVSISGSAPYTWSSPDNNIKTGSGVAAMTSPSSPPCEGDGGCAP